jgi:hypothetical protein
MKPTRLLAAALLLAGCGQVQTIQSDFSGLKGQSIASVVARVGPPASQQGATSVWMDRVADDTPVRQERTTVNNGVPTTIEVMVRPVPPIMRTCTLTVQADGAGTIVSVERDGTSVACAPMARKVAG